MCLFGVLLVAGIFVCFFFLNAGTLIFVDDLSQCRTPHNYFLPSKREGVKNKKKEERENQYVHMGLQMSAGTVSARQPECSIWKEGIASLIVNPIGSVWPPPPLLFDCLPQLSTPQQRVCFPINSRGRRGLFPGHGNLSPVTEVKYRAKRVW